MPRLIDGDALRNAIRDKGGDLCEQHGRVHHLSDNEADDWTVGYTEMAIAIRDAIDSAPTLDIDENRAFHAGYEAGKRDALKWVSVSERLPEEDGEYLVVLGRLSDKWGPSVDLRRFTKDMRKCFSVDEKFKRRPGWYFHDREWGDVEDTTATYWMRKPELPEAKEERE